MKNLSWFLGLMVLILGTGCSTVRTKTETHVTPTGDTVVVTTDVNQYGLFLESRGRKLYVDWDRYGLPARRYRAYNPRYCPPERTVIIREAPVVSQRVIRTPTRYVYCTYCGVQHRQGSPCESGGLGGKSPGHGPYSPRY